MPSFIYRKLLCLRNHVSPTGKIKMNLIPFLKDLPMELEGEDIHKSYPTNK